MIIKNIYMELNNIEKLVLLSLDDNDGKFISSGLEFNTSFIGAIIAELIFKGKLRISDKKVKVSNTIHLDDKVLDYVLDKIRKSKREHDLITWISELSMSVDKSIKITIKKLIDNKILEEKDSKILWIFNTTNYPAINSEDEDHVRASLKSIINKKTKASDNDKLLLSLIKSSELIAEVFGKENKKDVSKKINEIIKTNDFVNFMDKSIQEAYNIQLALLITIVT